MQTLLKSARRLSQGPLETISCNPVLGPLMSLLINDIESNIKFVVIVRKTLLFILRKDF